MADHGIKTLASLHSVDETLRRLNALLEARHISVFAMIDHSGEAAKAGLTMRPTKLVIFGNPKGGTPVMVASPFAAIDLPLKILIWADEDGTVNVSYNTPDYLARRHAIPPTLLANLAIVEAVAAKVVGPGDPHRGS
jgi:uncharacterized protein (DUF302 family)